MGSGRPPTREADELLVRCSSSRAPRTRSGRSPTPIDAADVRDRRAGPARAAPVRTRRRRRRPDAVPLRSNSASRGGARCGGASSACTTSPVMPSRLDQLHHELLVEAAERPHRADARDHERDRAHVQPGDVEQRVRDELADRSVTRLAVPAVSVPRFTTTLLVAGSRRSSPTMQPRMRHAPDEPPRCRHRSMARILMPSLVHTIVVGDDAVLRHVDQTARQVAGIRGLQRGVRGPCGRRGSS